MIFLGIYCLIVWSVAFFLFRNRPVGYGRPDDGDYIIDGLLFLFCPFFIPLIGLAISLYFLSPWLLKFIGKRVQGRWEEVPLKREVCMPDLRTKRKSIYKE